jgi:hypothetical protein
MPDVPVLKWLRSYPKNAKMKLRYLGRLLLILLLFLVSLPASIAHAEVNTDVTTLFTYQGSLSEQDEPATGFYDLRFTLFDALTTDWKCILLRLQDWLTGQWSQEEFEMFTDQSRNLDRPMQNHKKIASGRTGRQQARQLSNRRVRLCILLLFGLLWAVAPARVTHAQIDRTITKFVVAGGGGGSTSNSSRFTVTGTSGQPEAGLLAGGRFAVIGGFWSPAEVMALGINEMFSIFMPVIVSETGSDTQ